MIKKYLKVDIVSPKGSVIKCEADMVNLRGSAGDMGITYGHTELLSTLPAGVIKIKKDNNNQILYVSGGIVEVTSTNVTIMVDDMERSENIRKSEAEKSKERAIKILKNKDSSKLDIDSANTRLKEAEARLKTINSSKSLYYTKD